MEQIYDDLPVGEAAPSERIETVGTRVLDEIDQVLDMIDAAAGSATQLFREPRRRQPEAAGQP